MSKSNNIESLRYPIGKMKKPDGSKDQRKKWVEDIESFPGNVRKLVKDLSEDQLNWCYRPGGWTIHQVVHHTADSHMNAFVRFKLTLTEEVPTIKPYFEDKWAELPDTTEAPISDSLSLLTGLHSRWAILLKSMSEDDFKRKLYHPEHDKEFTLDFMLAMYAWHCRHHTAHIKQALEYKGQYS